MSNAPPANRRGPRVDFDDATCHRWHGKAGERILSRLEGAAASRNAPQAGFGDEDFYPSIEKRAAALAVRIVNFLTSAFAPAAPVSARGRAPLRHRHEPRSAATVAARSGWAFGAPR
jgi:hypothetical protein